MQIQDALQLFLEQLDADGRSRHTIRQYARHVRAFASWAATVGHDGAIGTVDERLVARFLVADVAKQRTDGGPRKPTSANALRTSLRVFLAFSHQAGWVARNPARLLRRAICSGPPPKALSEDDQRRLLLALDAGTSEADRRDRVLFRFLLETGIRIGSTLAMEVGDMDLEGGSAELRSMKRGREDRALLPERTCAMLREWLRDRTGGPVFGEVSVRQVQRRFASWLARAGISRSYTVHGLRHSFATRLYTKTRDIGLVKEALRHRNIASTMVYAACPGERVREAMGA